MIQEDQLWVQYKHYQIHRYLSQVIRLLVTSVRGYVTCTSYSEFVIIGH